jgi:RHS repeat-associated protein
MYDCSAYTRTCFLSAPAATEPIPCGQGACAGNLTCAGVGNGEPVCDGALPGVEVCGNAVDDDCDGETDCGDVEDCVPDWTYDICGPNDPRIPDGVTDWEALNYDCDGQSGAQDSDCGAGPEICGDTEDNDGNPATGDTDLTKCVSPETDPEGEGDLEDDCSESCRSCDGKPVHLVKRQAYVGPHEDVRIAGAQGPSFDLSFSRTWDSERANADHIDDMAAGQTAQLPYPRVLGPGWRHNLDVRLILDTGAPGSASAPRSILFDRPGGQVRLHVTSLTPLTYGRALGDPMIATRATVSGVAGWLVTESGGDRWFFADTTPTTLHPSNHVRIFAFYPAGVPLQPATNGVGARIRFTHEQDGGLPASWCTLVNETGSCIATRGLLVNVAQEWWTGTAWFRGNSLNFRYSEATQAGAGAKPRLTLARILEGADLDAGSTVRTRLADYKYITGGDVTWRPRLSAVANCADRMNGTADLSGDPCVDAGAESFKTYRYQYQSTSDPTIEDHLIEKVERPHRTSTGSVGFNTDESFSWDFDAVGPLVSTHLSQGVELSAPSGPRQPSGTHTWVRNGVPMAITFDANRVVESERCPTGGSCVTRSARVINAATGDVRAPVGYGRTVAGDGVTTLRILRDDGLVDVEAEVVPSSTATPPTMTPSTSTTVTFANVTAWRRVARNYYVGSPPRLVARASVSPVYDGETTPTGTTSTVSFPTTQSTWVYAGNAASRTPPAVAVNPTSGDAGCSGKENCGYYDVDVFDADTDRDGVLNEAGDDLVVWTHRARVNQGGVRTASSTRTTYDNAMRVLRVEELATARNGASYLRTARSDTAYPSSITGDNRDRGRALSQTVYSIVGSTLSSDGGAQVVWEACSSGSPQHDEFGHRECTERLLTQGGTAKLRVQQSTATLSSSSGVRRTTTITTAGSTTFPQTFTDVLAGVVVESGVSGGNRRRNVVATGSNGHVGATTEELLDSSGTVYRKSRIEYDEIGFVSARFQFDTGSDPRRETTYLVDDRGNVLEEIRQPNPGGAPATPLTSSVSYDPADDDQTSRVEPDGDVEEKSYFTSGVNQGRLRQIGRRPNAGGTLGVVRSFEYTLDGQVSLVRNGGTSSSFNSAQFTYDADGEQFDMIDVSSGTRTETTSTVVAKSGLGNVRIDTEKVFPTSTSTTPARWLERWFDGRGRLLLLCNAKADATCVSASSRLEEYQYDVKPAAEAISYIVEGTSRNLVLSSDNDLGSLTRVKHPAGVTIYQRDPIGRLTASVQNEGSAVQGTTMRATEYVYNALGAIQSIRYPSGRRVEYRYLTPDTERPTEVLVRVDPNGVNTINYIAGDIEYDVDDQPFRWRWGQTAGGADRWHRIVRDGVGRVIEVGDEANGQTVTELDYTYDDDGDVLSITDRGPYRPVSGQGSAVPATFALTYDSRDDMLTQFPHGPLQNLRLVNLKPTNRLRDNEPLSPGAPSYLYTPAAGERLSSFGSTTLSYAQTASAAPGDATAIGTTSLGYAPRGEVGTTTTYITHQRDDQRRRWRRSNVNTTGQTRFSYDASGRLLEQRTSFASGTNARDEYIYIGAVPVGVTHTDNLNPAPKSWHLSPDAMGTPRRIFERTTNLPQVSRLIMYPWGNAACTPSTGVQCLGQQTSEPNGVTGGIPSLPFRLPGQIADEDTGLSENGYRMYAPDLGQYLQADPMYASTSRSGVGPQAYAYGNGNPLRYVDRDGRTPRDVAKLVSWANNGIAWLTANGFRHENSMWNNFSSQEPGRSLYEMGFFPSPDYMNCIEQNNWMYSWLDQQEKISPLDDPWIRFMRQSSVVGTILGHSWMVCKNVGDCEEDERVLIDTWKGIARACTSGDPDCAAVANQ